jgi:phage terminase large subunit-like protein
VTLADDLRHALDPVAFAREVLGLELWQREVIASPGKRHLLNCSRQAGKSTTAAVLGLHEALYRPGSLTLLVSPSQRQSSELFRKVTELKKRLPTPPS